MIINKLGCNFWEGKQEPLRVGPQPLGAIIVKEI